MCPITFGNKASDIFVNCSLCGSEVNLFVTAGLDCCISFADLHRLSDSRFVLAGSSFFLPHFLACTVASAYSCKFSLLDSTTNLEMDILICVSDVSKPSWLQAHRYICNFGGQILLKKNSCRVWRNFYCYQHAETVNETEPSKLIGRDWIPCHPRNLRPCSEPLAYIKGDPGYCRIAQ